VRSRQTPGPCVDHPDARKVSVEDAYDAVRDELQPLPKTSGTEKL